MTYNVSNDFLFPEVLDDYPFATGESECLDIPQIIMPADWAEKEFFLPRGSGYSRSGPIVLYPWQREPLNAIYHYDTVIYCGPVQTGKSLLAEIAYWWVVKMYGLHAMSCYAKRETIENVFRDRMRPVIEQVPCIRALWDGDPDKLTKTKMSLITCILRVASAQVRDDIASHPAGLIYGSEVAKYREMVGDNKSMRRAYDVIKALRGRQESYGALGRKKAIFESSPLEEGDPLHREMYKPGVLNLLPNFPCPTCGQYQQLLLSQIKEIPNENKEFDHNPERIRQCDAAYYECAHCGNSIPEERRIEIGEKVVWATKDERINKDGTILSVRPKTSAVSFQWNRLVDYSYKYSECLARFFDASRSGSVVALRTFLNEDMAEFSTTKIVQRDTHWLMAKCGNPSYKITDEFLPNGVLVVIVCCDTQDNGFWYVMRGFGSGLESWLLDCDFIACDMSKDASPQVVLGRVNERIGRKKLETQNGEQISISMELWDRGGHKSSFVDYIVARRDNAFAYIGSKADNSPLIKVAEKSGLYTGNKKDLSRGAAKLAENENWHLPEDVPKDYLTQFCNQYEKEEADRYGNTVKRWVETTNDHCRDCENMIYACVNALSLAETLCDGEEVERLRMELSPQAQAQQSAPEPEPQNQYFAGIQDRWSRRW